DHRHDDPELDHQVRRGDLERHRTREVRSLTEERSCERHGGIGATRRRGAEPGSDNQGARRVIWKKLAHLTLGEDRLNRGGEPEAEDQRPKHLPGHAKRVGESLNEFVTQVEGDEHGSTCLSAASLERKLPRLTGAFKRRPQVRFDVVTRIARASAFRERYWN